MFKMRPAGTIRPAAINRSLAMTRDVLLEVLETPSARGNKRFLKRKIRELTV